MQWRKAAVIGGAALGAAAVYKASSARSARPLGSPLDGDEGEFQWRGHRIAYTKAGQGSPIVLVHGLHTGASSHEWRATAESLTERHTVFVLDLLGFGRSDRPAMRYTPALYQALLGEFIARVVSEPCAVAASALSAAHLIALAARDSRQIAALILLAPTGVAHLRAADGGEGGATPMLLGVPVVGNAVYDRLTSPATMRRFLELVVADDRLVTPALVDHYVRAARQPGGKHPVAALLSGRLNLDVRSALRRVPQPTLLLWGSVARQNPVEHAHAFRVLKPDLDWALLPDAGDLPHLDRPQEVGRMIRSFLERARQGVRVSGPRLMMA